MKDEIGLIDVTLRDGGFTCDFDWSIDFAQEYYSIMCDLGVNFVELGYWKQTAKSKNKFYNLDQQFVEKVTGNAGRRNVSVMIDYHYCSKNMADYPTAEQEEVRLIRMTARKDMIDQAIPFASDLKKHTGLGVSFNIFNVTNYTTSELTETVKKVVDSDFEYIYMADTHGHLDLSSDMEKYDTLFRKIKTAGKKTGFHLHDHTGKAFLNYTKCAESPYIDSCDTSIMSLGKGAGNLKLENVLRGEQSLRLSEFIHKHYDSFFKKTVSPYYLVTGTFNITDNYATQAEKLKVPMGEFVSFCSSVEHLEKDNYNQNLLKEYVK